MEQWRSMHDCMTWLRKGEPYFVHTEEYTNLHSALHLAQFGVVTIEGARLGDENDLLESLGKALVFPDYYSANWDAFADCLGDLASQRSGPMALVWKDADALLVNDLRAFVRAVHQLLGIASGLGTFQFEVFFVAGQDAFRNAE